MEHGKSRTREEAVELGNEMLKRNFFHHVHFDHNFKNDYLFYRFIDDEKTTALNASKKSKFSQFFFSKHFLTRILHFKKRHRVHYEASK